jgi:hypothetical protein
VIVVPDAVAVPWLAADATETEIAVPPERLNVIGVAAFAGTVAVTFEATGGPR